MTTFRELLEQIEKQALVLKNLHEKAEKLANDYKSIEDTIPKEKTYTWEECFSGNGFWLQGTELVDGKDCDLPKAKGHKNVATTEKVCLSHIAACQLSHIIESINKDYQGDDAYIICCEFDDSLKLYPMLTEYWALPYLQSLTGAECLIKHHTPLLKQYFGVK